MTNNNLLAKNFNKTYSSIKEVLEKARSTAFMAINFAMVKHTGILVKLLLRMSKKEKVPTNGYS